MGTTYFAICHECKVYRDVDKCGWPTPKSELTLEGEMEDLKTSWRLKNIFSAFSFFYDHPGHNCTLISTTSDLWVGELDSQYKPDGFNNPEP